MNKINTYFGTAVKDPYQWLEDDRSLETKAWVELQNKTTFDYLDNIPYRKEIREQLTALWNYEKIGAPFKKGDYTYFSKNEGLQNQNVYYRKKGTGKTELFLDPNSFSEDGTISLGSMSFSKNGKKLAYSISEGGSDWVKIITMDVETKELTKDVIENVKFSQISWYKNEGFYYSSYDKPRGSKLSAKTDQHKVYYHKLGTPQKKDVLVYGNEADEKHRYVYATVTEDDKYLIVTPRTSTSGNKLLIKDLSVANRPFIPVLNHTESDTYVIENDGSKLFLVTNLNAANRKLVSVDASNPSPENWVDVIPETTEALTVSVGGGYFFTHYMSDALSKVKQYQYDGVYVRTIELPDIGTASGFNCKKTEGFSYFYFTNYNTPTRIYKLDLETGTYELYWKPSIRFDSKSYESHQIFYTSKDGTKIPLMITHKKGLTLNGKNPTILYGYGGFNVSLTPSFSIGNAVWMNQGGILAVPNLRGGGEYGKSWHNAGTKQKKQNVFDDFIAAGNYLIKHHYTSAGYLALKGGSNGGLLVGAVMTQCPRFAQVALPAVGVLDMLRYHTFTAGAGWAFDYGTADESKEMFEYLKNYSPVHNVKNRETYPATLITTSDHDDRVVPAHSYKFAAELQKKSTKNPALIRVETDAGHGAGTSVSKMIEQHADVFSFALYCMGIKSLNKHRN